LLVAEPLPAPPDEFREVSLDELVLFFANPARYFCRKRLGVYPDDEDAELVGTENFNLDYLDRYQLGQIILDERLGEEAERDHFAVASRQGVMPHGSVARAAFCQLSAEVDELIGRLGMVGKGDFELLRGEIEIDSYLLSGQLETSPESGQVIYRYAKLKASDQIRGWLRHLYLNRLAPTEWSRTTRVIGKDRSISFQPLEGDDDSLAELLALYRQGLAAPLRFFPETSLAFAEAKRKGLADGAALFKAGRVWRGNDFARAEADDRYCRLCYNDQDPLDRDFAGVALAFFEPLLDGSDY
ncbi:MAG: hypothetical protein LC633_06315, partial [Desulfobulbaceae bacterium]|nr:hypothetical protein [Desulfobulbaceae bacterium]